VFLLSQLWRVLTDSWSSPRRARLVYIVLTAGFLTIAVAAAISGDALVAALGALFALATTTLALLVPRLQPIFAAAQRRRPDA
jgi:hypothetical protein